MSPPEPEPTELVWLDPWYPMNKRSQYAIALFERQLQLEVGQGHPLFGIPCEAFGKHDACDDVLFRLLDGTGRVAVVHLTWAKSPERPPWPGTTIYASLYEWFEERMKPDAAEYADEP